MGAVEDRLGETVQGISHRLQKLSVKGYLQVEDAQAGRQRGESRKTKRINVTFLPQAEAVLEELRAAESEAAELRFSGFTQEEREIYEKLTKKMDYNMQKLLSNYGSIISFGRGENVEM